MEIGVHGCASLVPDFIHSNSMRQHIEVAAIQGLVPAEA